MDAVAERDSRADSEIDLSARVYADARRTFAGEVDETRLEMEVAEVLDRLWTESTKVTAFIPVLALRDLRDRIEQSRGAPRS
jgi:hypothetical protein